MSVLKNEIENLLCFVFIDYYKYVNIENDPSVIKTFVFTASILDYIFTQQYICFFYFCSTFIFLDDLFSIIIFGFLKIISLITNKYIKIYICLLNITLTEFLLSILTFVGIKSHYVRSRSIT